LALFLLAVGAYHSLARLGWTELMARGIAAILPSDVVGYSRLMAVEARTHERLKALRQDFIGVAKLMGDGALSSAKENDHVHPIVFRHPALQHQCSGRGTGRSPPPPGGDPLA
jgi:hypothetical protein